MESEFSKLKEILIEIRNSLKTETVNRLMKIKSFYKGRDFSPKKKHYKSAYF